jgi:hypothetical protein
MDNPTYERHCICGALLDTYHPELCRKCTARDRYRRRRAHRRGNSHHRGDLA